VRGFKAAVMIAMNENDYPPNYHWHTDLPENIERVRGILKRMDRRPRQVLIEATILKVSLDDETSLGVDFNALAGVDFRELSTTTVPVADPTGRANDLTTPVTVAGATRPWGQIRTTDFATSGTGFNVGVITNTVAFFIHALETVTDTMVVGNPKVLALNKQRSEVKVGKRYGYVTTTHTETTDVQTVNFLDTGTQLIFRPFISDDGYVRMEIHPKVSTGEVVGGLPNETTTEVTCNIMVKDGYTIVIGGLFDETATVARTQVPGLGNIPLLGWAFRSNTDTSKRNEIIVLLTPHIIDDDEAANTIGQETLEDANRRCLGVREGFAFFTRERLTTGWMQEADKAWQRYEKTGSWIDRAMAWWNVELVLNASPNTLKAMRLKDQVLSDNKDEPRQPPNWTIWDNLRERLRAMDDQKRAKAEEQKAKAEPPKAEPQTPAPKTPSAPKRPPAEKAPPAGKTPSADKTPAAEKAPAAEPKPSVTAMATPSAPRDQEVAHAE
jgi:hypothetical protein